MGFGGWFKAGFIGTLLNLGLLTCSIGCSNKDYLFSNKPLDVKVSHEKYAKHLECDKFDSEFTTDAEILFEERYPKLNLKGENSNLTQENIDVLISALNKIPERTLSNLEGDIILAMENRENRNKVDYSGLINNAEYKDQKIIIYKLSKYSVLHEFAHLIHLYRWDSERNKKVKSIEKRWKSIEIVIDNDIRKLKDVYGDKSLFQPERIGNYALRWKNNIEKQKMQKEFSEGNIARFQIEDFDLKIQKYGFAWAYGANNLMEDIATTNDFILERGFVRDKEYFPVFDKKAGLLAEMGILKEENYSKWKCLNLFCYAESLDEHLFLLENSLEERHIAKAIIYLTDNDKNMIYSKKILPLLESQNGYVKWKAFEYFIENDKEMKFEKDIIPFLESEDINLVICALDYLFANDSSRRYSEKISEKLRLPELRYSDKNKFYMTLITGGFFEKVENYYNLGSNLR